VGSTRWYKKRGTFEMRSGSHVQLAALRNRDLELQPIWPFSNYGSVEWSAACCSHKNVLQKDDSLEGAFFCVTLYMDESGPGHCVSLPRISVNILSPYSSILWWYIKLGYNCHSAKISQPVFTHHCNTQWYTVWVAESVVKLNAYSHIPINCNHTNKSI
jgi:hypothetical protein